MKRFIYLIILLLPLVNGCTKTDSSPTLEKFDRYIFFSQGVETKASLIENKANLDGQTFGVVGFKYDNTLSWDAVKTSATPNVFRDATGNMVETEILTCSADGTATYAPLQGWSNTKKFSFFAYYPFENQNVTLVNLDGTPYTGGTPAIKYTMDPDSFQSSMVDVMTATAQTDKYWNSASDNNVNNSDIRFKFAHCLACLGLNVKKSSSGEITIKSVTLVVDGIKYTSVTIPLDASVSETYAGPGRDNEGLYLMLKDTEKTVTETGKEVADKLIFIPQTDNISITLTINYQRQYGESNPTDDSFTTTTPLTTSLLKGIKNIIYVNFTDSNTYVMIRSNDWDDGPNVNHEFN